MGEGVVKTNESASASVGSMPAVPVSCVPLTQLRAGQTGVLVEAQLEAGDAALLRAMGLCDRSTLRLCRLGEPCVVAVGGRLAPDAKACTCGGTCRIGLARPLAERIFVSVLA